MLPAALLLSAVVHPPLADSSQSFLPVEEKMRATLVDINTDEQIAAITTNSRKAFATGWLELPNGYCSKHLTVQNV